MTKAEAEMMNEDSKSECRKEGGGVGVAVWLPF